MCVCVEASDPVLATGRQATLENRMKSIEKLTESGVQGLAGPELKAAFWAASKCCWRPKYKHSRESLRQVEAAFVAAVRGETFTVVKCRDFIVQVEMIMAGS